MSTQVEGVPLPTCQGGGVRETYRFLEGVNVQRSDAACVRSDLNRQVVVIGSITRGVYTNVPCRITRQDEAVQDLQ
ncbi:hypothetical protein EON66_09910 [archaeon]|nr:MAG: hypothetical protein EON66_09910 [archaeon]